MHAESFAGPFNLPCGQGQTLVRQVVGPESSWHGAMYIVGA